MMPMRKMTEIISAIRLRLSAMYERSEWLNNARVTSRGLRKAEPPAISSNSNPNSNQATHGSEHGVDMRGMLFILYVQIDASRLVCGSHSGMDCKAGRTSSGRLTTVNISRWMGRIIRSSTM